MGQQQLLLLVLATVIVGLATVAGIQAFDQGQQQAATDALTQRAVEIATDIQAQDQKPQQLGGLDLSSSGDNAAAIAASVGFSSAAGIEAGGAGEGARCEITKPGSGTAAVKCSEGNSEVGVKATYKPSTDPDIQTTMGSGITAASQ